MKKVITLVLWNRPAYTRTVLDALRRCEGIEDYAILAHVEPGNARVLELVRGIDFAKIRVTVNQVRLGIGANTRRAWEHGFRMADFIIHLEDDTVPAPDCLRFFEHCREAYRGDRSVFSVSAYNRDSCRATDYYHVFRRRPFTCWAVGLWRDRWDWVKDHWSPDTERYATHLSRYLAGFDLQEIYPLLSRTQNIGARGGVHVPSPGWHHKHQHTRHWAGAMDIPPAKFEESAPLVTAVMITGLHRDRYPLARVAIDCFRNQSYPNRELLIINHGDESLHVKDPRIRELRITKQKDQTVGDLRNMGIEHAAGNYVISWDDDDWHHPKRIESQMAARRGSDDPVFLCNRIHYSFVNRCAGYHHVPEGADATILHPRDVPFRYPSLVRGSDTAFARQFGGRIALDNNPGFYIRFFHGLNLWSAKHIMGNLASPDLCDEWRLEPRHRRQLSRVLELYRDHVPGVVPQKISKAGGFRRTRSDSGTDLKHLILIPRNGVGNRLRAIASARRLCARLNARCSIVWDWGRFERYFQSMDDVELLSRPPRHGGRVMEHQSWHLDACREVDVAVRQIELHTGFVFWGSDERPIQLRDVLGLVPLLSRGLQRRVDDFADSRLRHAVGFHIRRTDSRQSIRSSPDELFIRAGHKVVAAGKKIFLCTDNVATEAKFRSLFGSEIITFPKQKILNERWPRDFDAKALEDDLVELFLLSRTSHVLGSHWSSFSSLAIALNGSPASRILASGSFVQG